MKKFFVINAALVLLFSCKKDVTSPKEIEGSSNPGSGVGIETTSTHLETDLPITYQNYACGGEVINFTGSIHVNYNVRRNGVSTIGTEQVTTILTGTSGGGAGYNALESHRDVTTLNASKEFTDKHLVSGPYFAQGRGTATGSYKYLLVYQYDSLHQQLTVTVQDFQLVCGG